MEFSLDTVRTVARLLQESNLTEISIEAATQSPEPCRLTVRRAAPVPAPPKSLPAASGPMTTPSVTGAAVESPATTGDPGAGSDSEAPVVEAARVTVTATAVGIFRNSLPPHRLGEIVQAGQVIGIVESLKVPTEITAPVAGRVIEVLVEEGQGVEYGQPLISLGPTPADA